MGENEEQLIVGQLVLDLKASEGHLGCLQAKAKMMGEALLKVSRLLLGSDRRSVVVGPDYPDKEDVESLLIEMKETEEKIVGLRESLSKMGVDFDLFRS